MNAKAARACRAWLAAGAFDARARKRAYRHAKRTYAQLSHQERGALRGQWTEAEAVRHHRGDLTHKAKAALVKPAEFKL